MAGTKRSREASKTGASDGDESHYQQRKKPTDARREASKPSSLEIMLKLPQEILAIIFELACFSRPLRTASADRPLSSPHSNYDHDTTLSLLTSSRVLCAQVNPIVYRHVKITRPSSLALFHQTLLSRPALAKLVKRFELGPDDALPAQWWPLRVCDDPSDDDMDDRWLANGVQGNEADQLPVWSSPALRSMPDDFDFTCAGQHFWEAFIRAQADIDVTFYDGPRGYLGDALPADVFIDRIFRLQAAMDLYMFRMRRLDNTGLPAPDPFLDIRVNPACEGARCGHYPQMVVKEQPLKQQPPPGIDCLVTLFKDLQSHLARRGSPIDRFDHPLLFARSKLNRYEINDNMRPVLKNEGPYRLPEDGSKAQALDLTTFAGVVSLTRAVLSLLPAACLVKMRPKVLKESVKLGWKRKEVVEAGV